MPDNPHHPAHPASPQTSPVNPEYDDDESLPEQHDTEAEPEDYDSDPYPNPPQQPRHRHSQLGPAAPEDQSITSGHGTPNQLRRNHHNTHTRRCRARLNWRFQALNDMLPHNTSSEPKHKVQILDHAISSLTSLRQENAQLELMLALRSKPKIIRWVDSFVPNAPSLLAALDPLTNLICQTANWPYAECWRISDGTIAMRSFFVRCPPVLQQALSALGRFTHSHPTHASQDFAGRAFETCRPAWTSSVVDACHDARRAHLIAAARLRTAFAVPVPVGGEVSHALVFYDVHQRAREEKHEEFASFAAVSVGNCYGARQLTDGHA